MCKRSLLCFALILGGCNRCHRLPPPPPAAAASRPRPNYLDLRAGWRVRTVTAITRSGSLIAGLKTKQEDADARTVTVEADRDLLGYELAYYAVGAKGRDGVRVRFASAEQVRGEARTPTALPLRRLFNLPRPMRHVRLLYLLRHSASDHDMAILAARTLADLRGLTIAVQAAPATACRTERRAVCNWVPRGIAVLAQKPRGGDWVAAP